MGHLPLGGAGAWHSLAGDDSAGDGRVHCRQAYSEHAWDLPAVSMGRQGQGLHTSLLHAGAGGASWPEGATDLAW